MPKRVDHVARRDEIAQAALRLCAREGLAAVTVGLVAREAGMSKGLVQHYFGAKIDLLHATATRLRSELQRHVAAAVVDATGPEDQVRRLLLCLVRLGTDQPLLVLVGHAFLAQSTADPQARTLHREGADAVHAAVTGLIQAARPGLPGAGAEAHVLLGLARGLADSVLVESLTFEEAVAVLDHQLDRTLGSQARRASSARSTSASVV